MVFVIIVKLVVCGNLGRPIQAYLSLLCGTEKASVRLFLGQMDMVRPALPIEHSRIAITLDDIRCQVASTRVSGKADSGKRDGLSRGPIEEVQGSSL